MKFVIQCVQHASVTIEGTVAGKIGRGMLVFCGIAQTDTEALADRMIKKLCALRIFEDAEGKTNLSLADISGELMLIYQFTLYADCKKGNRPSFFKAGDPGMASPLYDYLLKEAEKYVPNVQHGIFGAYMKIDLCNDGPFTVILDSDELFSQKP